MNVCIFQAGWVKPFIIKTDDSFISDFFLRSYNGSICDGKDIDGTLIEIGTSGGCPSVSYNGQTVETASPVQSVSNLIFEEAVYRNDIFPMHGGGIAVSGRACLFPASTQAGKTTLITYLTKTGYPYINDDYILIDTDTLNVVPDASPVHLRPESLPILESYGCSVNGIALKTERINRIVYTPECIQSEPLPVGDIFFIERSETENKCTDIDKGEAVKMLMSGLLSPRAADGIRLRCAIRLASKCKRLIYSDMRYVADILNGGETV